jgi:biotin operon repressor
MTAETINPEIADRRAKVAKLASSLSQNAIAEALGASRKTIRADLAGIRDTRRLINCG